MDKNTRFRRAAAKIIFINQLQTKDVRSSLSRQRNSLDAPTRHPIERWCVKVIKYRWYCRLLVFFTITALFADDIRLATCPRSSDIYFSILAASSIIFFTVELILRLIAVPSTRPCSRGLFSWVSLGCCVDLINILSLFFDISNIMEGAEQDGITYFQWSRTSFRAANMVRLLWVFRTPRLIAAIMRCARIRDPGGNKGSSGRGSESREQIKVEKSLNEQTSAYLVFIVLVLGFLIPWLDGTMTEHSEALDDTYQQGGLDWIHHFPQDYNQSGAVTSSILQQNVRSYAKGVGSLLYLDLCVPLDQGYVNGCDSSWSWSTIKPWLTDLPHPYLRKYDSFEEIQSTMRPSDYLIMSTSTCYHQNVSITTNQQCHSMAVVSIRGFTTLWSWLNIVKTLAILVVLTFTTTLFFFDARRLVIGPIQRMTDMVRRLAENPLAALKHASLTLEDQKGGMETQLLEDVLAQIGHLLQIGFGAAGAEIIGQNVGEGELNPLMPGKKITSIYGFCDIRQFTDTTECLQGEVFSYVNAIASIVHGSAHSYYGMANKNVGDAFLLSWKLCDGLLSGYSDFMDIPDEETRMQANETVRCPPSAGIGEVNRVITPTEMADSALTAFLKCRIDMEFSNHRGALLQHRTHPSLLKRFPNGDFFVRCGFGMHVGWAVEGAIGSTMKIDATYISPHVDMAERLESSSKKYDSPLIMSHWFVGLLSPAAQNYLRPVDCITAKAIPVPVTLYTFDVAFDVETMRPNFGAPTVNAHTRAQIPVDFQSNTFYRHLQVNLHPAFLTSYRAGFECYLDGEWNEAQQLFQDALNFKQGDAPILRLLERMEATDFVPPPDWDGSVFDAEF